MHLEALEKVLEIARRSPKVLLSPSYFEKISARLNIDSQIEGTRIMFRYNGREAKAEIITPGNCEKYKCSVKEGKTGTMIYEYINALVILLTNEDIPPSPHKKLGPTAEFYCSHGVNVLRKNLI
ncbi:hypothetical protein [Phosphitispora sp. TUW77]|uniref:hypothetical protein n=1 Tax=Phosphitispora sp. TUW77 TaxID=3152361 RepID=UPI003AB918BD